MIVGGQTLVGDTDTVEPRVDKKEKRVSNSSIPQLATLFTEYKVHLHMFSTRQ